MTIINKFIIFFVIFLWSIIGFFVWIPFLIRMISIYISALVSSMLVKTKMDSSAQSLKKASSFYVEGFTTIRESFCKKKNYSQDSELSDDSKLNFSKIIFIVLHIVWTVGFWDFIYNGKSNFIYDVIRIFQNIYVWFINIMSNLTLDMTRVWNISWNVLLVAVVVAVVTVIVIAIIMWFKDEY